MEKNLRATVSYFIRWPPLHCLLIVAPTKEELDGVLQAQIREIVLYREALIMVLDEGDLIIRRVFGQKLERIARDLVELSAMQPTLRRENQLSGDPAPVVRTIAVEPVTLWVPLLSLVPLGALLLGPVGGLAWALPNVYRALEFSTESAVYDRLALSVAGKILSEVYLQQRRAVEAKERGGARTRVEAVEVLAVAAVSPDPGSPRGFVADVNWTVGGTVTHFGHRHFRQNRYDAQVTVVPVDGSWKIQSIEVFDEKRLQ